MVQGVSWRLVDERHLEAILRGRIEHGRGNRPIRALAARVFSVRDLADGETRAEVGPAGQCVADQPEPGGGRICRTGVGRAEIDGVDVVHPGELIDRRDEHLPLVTFWLTTSRSISLVPSRWSLTTLSLAVTWNAPSWGSASQDE